MRFLFVIRTGSNRNQNIVHTRVDAYRSRKKHQILLALAHRSICAGMCMIVWGYACMKIGGTSRSNVARNVTILTLNFFMLTHTTWGKECMV